MHLVYSVHAYRWGDRENHSYPVGVFLDKDLALDAAGQQEVYRGGKYECEVLEWDLSGKPTELGGMMKSKPIKDIDNYERL